MVKRLMLILGALCVFFSASGTSSADEAPSTPPEQVVISHTGGTLPPSTGTDIFLMDRAGLIRSIYSLEAVPGYESSPDLNLGADDPQVSSQIDVIRVGIAQFEVFEIDTDVRRRIHSFRVEGDALIHTNHRRQSQWIVRADGHLGSLRVDSNGGRVATIISIDPDGVILNWPQAEHTWSWIRNRDGSFSYFESTGDPSMDWAGPIERTRDGAVAIELRSPETAAISGRLLVHGQAPISDSLTAAINFQILSREFPLFDSTSPYIFAPHLATDEGVNVVTSSVFTEVLGGERVYYLGKNLLDDDPSTAWVEGHPGDGVGEWVDLLVPEVSSFHSLTVRNGFQANAEWYHKNGRVRGYRILVDEVEVHRGELPDRMGEQEITFAPVEGQVLRFEVTSIYEGTHYTDLVISDLSVGYR